MCHGPRNITSGSGRMPIAWAMPTQLKGLELDVRPNALASLMAAGEFPEAPVCVSQPAGVVAESAKPQVLTPLLVHASNSSRIKRLSIVVPARNECLNMAGLLDELNEVLSELDLPFCEVIVVNDGSTDNTAQLARDRDAKVVTHAVGLGNGAAVKRGIREAKGDWILLLDGDGQHPPHELPAMIREAELYDMVVASRGGSGGSIHRNIANQVYNRFGSYVSGRKIPDPDQWLPTDARRRCQEPRLVAAQHVQLSNDDHHVDASRWLVGRLPPIPSASEAWQESRSLVRGWVTLFRDHSAHRYDVRAASRVHTGCHDYRWHWCGVVPQHVDARRSLHQYGAVVVDASDAAVRVGTDC